MMEPPATVFVTGATGFIGTQLVHTLIERGHTVRALTRRPKPDVPPALGWEDGGPFASERCKLVLGDITDRRSLAEGMGDATHVFHLAGYAKNWAPDPRTFHEINVQGMRNVFDAAKEAHVRRIVWTSTAMTIGPTRRGQVGSEDMPRISERFFTEYEESKAAAEESAAEYVRDGLSVVIVNTTRVYGPGHLTEGNSVSLLIDQYDRGKAPILPNRGVNVGNWVLVDDVVQGLVLAMEKGRIGDRYLLGGENASLREFFRLVDEVSGKRHFQVPVFFPGAMVFAWLQKKRAEWLGIYPQITPGWVRTFFSDAAYTCQKAESELGYRWTPLADGVRRTYQWLMQVRGERS
jgi:farnesol dehydrogenase